MQNNADINKIKTALVLKGIISETKYVCVLTCQIGSFQHNSNKFWTGGGGGGRGEGGGAGQLKCFKNSDGHPTYLILLPYLFNITSTLI